MSTTEDNKALERKARYLISNKEIPPSTMSLVRSYITNLGISPDERYKTIIGLIKNCPDKAAMELEDVKETKETKEVKDTRDIRAEKKKPAAKSAKQEPAQFSDHSHTDTSLYIDEIYRRFKPFKFFKIRYLARRNNRFNIGFKKRLIPSKKLLKALADVYAMQSELLARLPLITMNILNDESIDNPTSFNYLRMIRNWLTEQPLAAASYDNIKWMERANFEREFKKYLCDAFAFQRLNDDKKDSIQKHVKEKLILMEDLKKEDVYGEDSDLVKKEKEQRNFEIDKKIYYFVNLLHSFMYDDDDNNKDNPVYDMLHERYGINGYNTLMTMIIQALIYQRQAKIEDFVYKFEVKSPEVSSVDWNYSDEYLKKVGKDPGSRNQKVLEQLRERLVPYDVINTMLEIKDGDIDLVTKGVGTQWKIIDKNKVSPIEVFNNDFPVFLEGGVLFFKNLFVPLINGSALIFNDREKKEIVSSIFAQDFFIDDIKSLKKLLTDIHEFRSENPMLVVSRDETVRIMRGQIVSMNHVETLVRGAGDFFYNIAKKLFPYYDSHTQWIKSEKPKTTLAAVRTPLVLPETEDSAKPKGALPFYDCLIIGFDKPAPLTAALENKKIIGLMGDGIIDNLLAYSYQAANFCLNAELLHDIEERSNIIHRIDDLEKTAGGKQGANA
ncbi:MAG: hypothetical protein LBT84_02565 [Spirochaetia bacterium]|jgi:hypothetical protein|nr:hypothetical protein [Spirochaetia bacterium]